VLRASIIFFPEVILEDIASYHEKSSWK